MNRIYLSLAAVFLVLVSANIYYYYNIYRQQVSFQENMLIRQTEICSWEIEQHVSNFMNELNYILFTEDMSEFFRDPGIMESGIRKIDVFFSKYKTLITSISLYDNERNAYNVFRDKSNNLVTDIYVSRVQRELYEKEKMDDIAGESVFVLPAFRDNTVVANLVIRIDTRRYIESVFANFHIEETLWQWLISRDGEIIFSNFEPDLPDIATREKFTDIWPEPNTPSTLIHTIDDPDRRLRVISAFYPVRPMQRDMLVVFSLDTSIVVSYIINSILTIAAATFIVLMVVILFFIWFVRNEQKDRQRSEESEKAIREIFESLPVGIIIKSSEGRVKMINSAAVGILSLDDPKSVIGKDFSNMFFLSRHYPGDKERNNEERTSEYVYYDSGENEVIVYKKEIPAIFLGEKVSVDAFIDITPIEQARKKEYIFGEAKTEFLKRVSHDIRNPLNGILNITNAIEAEMKPEDEDLEKTALIKRCCEDILLVVNDILDFSSLELSKTIVEEIPFVLPAEIDVAVRPISVKAEEKNIVLATTIAENVPKNIIGDPFHLRQVLTNLLSNSLKYTSEGEIRLKIETRKQKGSNIVLDFIIEDTGKGMNENLAAVINKEGDLCENLALQNPGMKKTCQLIKLMKGDMKIESPLYSEPGTGGPGTRIVFSVQAYSNDISGKRLLIDHITDYKDIKALVLADPGEKKPEINKMLRKMGIACDTTTFNENTIDTLKSYTSDDPARNYSIIVIVDSEKSNGFSIARSLHENHLDENYLIIITSSVNKPGNFVKTKRFGADHYLIEPYDASEIFDIIQNNFLHVAIPSARTQHLKKTKPGLKILVAEDNQVNQIVAQSLFKSIGYEIDIVSNGREALEKVREKEYDIVFMDIRMPLKNGLDATYEIRKLGYTMPIVAMTANASESDKTEAIEVGMNDFIPKPVRIEMLKNIIIKNFSE